MKKLLVILGFGLFMLPQLVMARDIFLRNRTESICVDTSKTIIYRVAKFDILEVNGETKRFETFWYHSGAYSSLKLDFSIPQHVVAKCKSIGMDTYDFIMSLDGGPHGVDIYHETVTVDCRPCPRRRFRPPPRVREPIRRPIRRPSRFLN